MKRLVKHSENNARLKLDVVFNIDLTSDTADGSVAAATYRGIDIPEGKLPPADKNAIMNSQVYRDYRSFIDAVEEMLIDYNFNIYYRNESEYDSFYWSGLAKDDNGNNLVDFTVRLRVSTHDAHRTKESQQNKKEEKRLLKKLSGGRRVTPLPINVVVNDESTDFKSYLDAIVYIDERIERAYEIMTRK